MMKLWEKILNFFHLYTRSQMNQKLADNTAYYDAEIVALRTSTEQTVEGLKRIIFAYETLQLRYDEVAEVVTKQYDMITSLNKVKENLDKQLTIANQRLRDMERIDAARVEEVARYKEAAMKNIEYVKDVQKQLSEVLHDSIAFGFPNKVAIPGSTSIRTDINEDSANGDMIIVRGRTLLTDDMTPRINDTPDMHGRLELIFGYMERYGVLSTITKNLIRSGAITFTLAYNDHCTAYEMYYECAAKRQNETSLVVINNMKKLDVEGQ